MEWAERLRRALPNEEQAAFCTATEAHSDKQLVSRNVFFLKRVLRSVDVDIHRKDVLRLLDEFDASLVLRELSEAVTSVEEGFRRLAIARTLAKVMSVEFVTKLLSETRSRQQARTIAHLLTNLPAKLANSLKLDLPSFFRGPGYSALLTDACCGRITRVAEELRQNRDSCLGCVAAVVGKLGVHYPETFDRFVPFFLSQPDDFVFRRVVQRLVVGLPVDLQENALVLICYRTPCFRQMDWLLEDSVTRDANVKHVLVKKLLLSRCFSNDRVLKNVIGYLCSSGRRAEVASEALMELCTTWSDKVLMKYQTVEQQMYLTAALLTFTGFMKSGFVVEETHREKCMRTILHGVQNHLSYPDELLRKYGMLVGKEFLAAARSDMKAVDFDVRLGDFEDLSTFLDTPSETLPSKQTIPEPESSTKSTKRQKARLDSDDDSQSDDDNDDVLYEMDAKCKVPLYLRDCLRLMVPGNDGENIEQAKICLEHLPKLIRRHPAELIDTAVDLCRFVLYAQECPRVFPEIGPLRRECLVLLLIHAPRPSSTFLIEQFYSVHVNHTQRLEILASITLASDRYAAEAPTPRQAEPKSTRPLKSSNILQQLDKLTVEGRKVSEWTSGDFDVEDDVARREQSDKPKHDGDIAEVSVVDRHWQAIVEERIARKTKKLTSKTNIVTTENRFGEVAGYFFYPLMRSLSATEACLRVGDEDSFLLVQLLNALGVIMSSARHAPCAVQMGRALLNFATAFRYHDHEAVRQACAFAIASVFRSVPEDLLEDERVFGAEAGAELGPWLESVTTKMPTFDVKLPTQVGLAASISVGPSPLSTRRIQELN